jgi:hypothetical protein
MAVAVLVGCASAALLASEGTEPAEMAAQTMQAVGSASATESGPVEAEPGVHYSPFMLELHDKTAPFHAISFKDVGMSVPREHRAFVYESMAESLALALGTQAPTEGAPLMSRVTYSTDIADPENHRACEGGHLYVDVWRNASDEDWGYSLWSGCGEDDQFAWKELPKAAGNTVQSLEPLAHDIAQSIREAVETDCFTRHC